MTDNDSSPNNSQEALDDDWLIDSPYRHLSPADRASITAIWDRFLAKAPKPKSRKAGDFDVHFRSHALPKLLFWARYLGKHIALDDWQWSRCCDVLEREALALGAHGLADYYSLLEYLADQMMQATLAHEQEQP